MDAWKGGDGDQENKEKYAAARLHRQRQQVTLSWGRQNAPAKLPAWQPPWSPYKYCSCCVSGTKSPLLKCIPLFNDYFYLISFLYVRPFKKHLCFFSFFCNRLDYASANLQSPYGKRVLVQRSDAGIDQVNSARKIKVVVIVCWFHI